LKNVKFAVLLQISFGWLTANAVADWPQASGPQGNFVVAGNAVTEFSVSNDQNVLWVTPLPSTGQGGVVVVGDRLFVTSHEPISSDTELGTNIFGMCFDAGSGAELWRREISGVRETDLSSLFSDNTAATPVASEDHVVFINVGGSVQCFDHQGNGIWSQRWTPFGRHHARQHEPFLLDDTVVVARVTMDDLPVQVTTKEGAKELGRGREYWNHLQARDVKTGDLRWIADAGTSVHSTSTNGRLADGTVCVLTGRGGGHQPPEEPYGLSLVRAKDGTTVWERSIERYGAHQNVVWNNKVVAAFAGDRHITLDTASGATLNDVSLQHDVAVTRQVDGKYQTLEGQQVKGFRKPLTLQSNILVGDYHYFRAHHDYLIGRVDVQSGKVEYLQVPVQVQRRPGESDVVSWTKAIKNDMKNADGYLATQDRRNAGDGWGHVSAASPIVVGDYLYMPTMLGMVYVIRWQAEQLDGDAFVAVADLGPVGETWSLSNLSYANGKLYARTLKHLVCLGVPEIAPKIPAVK